MIKFKGRCSLKQYMPKKPIKRGFKVWVIADKSGYCLKFDIYTGKQTADMCGKNHIVYFDNFFNSFPLMETLKQNNIHAVGTINLNRKYLPIFKSDQSLKRGDVHWFTSNSGLAAIKWKDNRSVHILSNFHDPEKVIDVRRKLKRQISFRDLVQKQWLTIIKTWITWTNSTSCYQATKSIDAVLNGGIEFFFTS